MWYQGMLSDPLLKVFFLILALAIGWLLIRFIFKLAMRVFMIGCAAILLLGGVLILLGYIQF